MLIEPTDLPRALPAELRAVDGKAGRTACYVAGPASLHDRSRRPLLLVHSVNAAASAYEMRPLFEHYRQQRPVYAPDLPGFGLADRPQRVYTPRLMTDALHDVLMEIRREHGDTPVDAIALSLSCEFLARAAVEQPAAFRSLGLVSPTGFSGTQPRRGAPGTNRGRPLALRLFTFAPWSRALFAALTSRPSLRFFLRKTWGGKGVDSGLMAYDYLVSHQPGARHAPYSFVSGYLFSADVFTLYESLRPPVWMAHGVRGDFTDYRLKRELAARKNWTIEVFETGALPHFEVPHRVTASYDAFIAALQASP